MPGKNQQSLPHFLNQFVGRVTEIEQLDRLVNAAQLVTVIGMPGLGKTRLSIEVARRVGERLQDGAHFVSLEGVRDLPATIQATADALSLPPASKLDVESQLSFALSRREMLLVLDAAEGVVSDEFAAWVRDTLNTSPSLRLLVTSQQPRLPELPHRPHRRCVDGLQFPAMENQYHAHRRRTWQSPAAARGLL